MYILYLVVFQQSGPSSRRVRATQKDPTLAALVRQPV